MTLPLSILLPTEPKELSKELMLTYQDIANNVNGHQASWTPIVKGGTSSGTGTYTEQKGYYYLQGILVDCWFSITMSAHTGTGDMKIKLPFKIKTSSDLWIGEVSDSNLTYPSGTHLALRGTNGSRSLKIIASGSGIASAIVQIDGTSTVKGHIRYIGII